MKNRTLSSIIALVAVLSTAVSPAFASETTGTISTGLGNNEANGVVITAPALSPAAGTFSSTQSVTLSATGASNIRYTVDGTTPNCTTPTGTLYSSAISVSSTKTVKAISCYANSVASSVTSGTYTIDAGGAIIGGGGGGGGGAPSAPGTTTTTTDTPKTDTPVSLEFKDAKTHWSKDFAEKLRTKCGILGYKDAKGVPLGMFKPDNNITRAELMKMVVDCKFKTVDVPTVNPFNDVPKGEWYAPAIATAKKLGWTNGYNNGTLFKPMQPITRAEAMKLILLSQFADTDVVKDAESMKLFKDVKEDWYTKYITFAVMKGFASGYKDGSGKLTGFFGTFNNITRGETAKIIVNVQGL